VSCPHIAPDARPPQHRGPPSGSGWRLEPKLDGWRVIVTIDAGLAVHTRSGRDITRSLPPLAGLANAVARHEVVLDGELIAGAGRACDQVAPTIAASAPRPGQPLRLAVFDLLWLDGDLCRRPTANPVPA
jgi:bifunctional non-homologous end joining protein LigD